MARLALALPALLAAFALSTPGRADEPSAPAGAAAPAAAAEATGPASADTLFTEGSALLKAGKVDDACAKLETSQSLEPAIGTLGLLAFCHELQGKLATAMREYGEVAELAHMAGQGGRENVARQRVTDLSGRVSRLSVVMTESSQDVEVFIDTRRLGVGEIGASTPVDAGTVELRIQGKEVEPWSKTLSIPADGSTLRVVVPRLQARAVAPRAAPGPAPAPAPAAEASNLRRTAAWVGFGVGGLGVAIGSYFGVAAMSAQSDADGHCRGNACDRTGVDARERGLARARISTIAFSVGALSAAAGAVLLLTDSPREPRQQAAVTWLPGGAGLALERRF